MRRALPFLPLVLGGLLVALAVAAAPRTALEWQRGAGAQRAERAAEFVAALPDEVRITHYVGDRADLPSDYDALPQMVQETLEALFAETERVALHAADPDDHPAWSSFLSAAGVAPWRARSVERDGWTERRLWSSLRLECGPRPAAVWNGVGPDDLPLLAPWVLGRIEQLTGPRAARIGLDAPADYGVLRARLAAHGELVEVDVADAGASLDDLDWLLVAEPGALDADVLARLDDLLASGGSVALAASRWTASETARDDEVVLTLVDSGFPADVVFAHYGLDADALPLFDERNQALPGPGGDPLPRPWRVRCIAPNQDFRALAGQPNGDLPFVAPTSFRLDSEALAARGRRGTVIASSDETSYRPAAEEGARTLAEWDALPAREDGNAPLAALLESDDPWAGSLVVFGAASPFEDEALADTAGAPTALVRVLADTLGSDERLVRRRLAGERPASLPELAPGARLAWRLGVVLAIPLLLGAATLLASHGGSRRRTPWRPLVPVAVGLVLLGVLAPALGGRGVALSPRAVSVAGRAADVLADRVPGGDEVVRVATLFSLPGDLPPELREPAREAEALCAALAERVPGLAYDGVRAAREGAVPPGWNVESLALGSTLDERTTLRRVHAHLVVERGSDRVVTPLADAQAVRDIPFRLALALDELATGAPRRLAVLANPPQLSPAEAEFEYTRKGLHPPRGGEAYEEALAALEDAGFTLAPFDGESPTVPGDAAAFLWLQPRRDTLPGNVALADWLARGGRALVAGQHYRVLARQRSEAEGELHLWPQPQYCDLDRHYLPALGVALAPEVLCDRLHASLSVPTQVALGGGAEIVRQESAQPFFLRVPSANRAPDFAGAADLLLPSGNRWIVDEERLEAHGLRAEVLAETSESPWSYAWSGGDLPPEALAGEPDAEGRVERLGGRQPLALRITGAFPSARVVRETRDGRGVGRLEVATEASGPDGRLMLLGGTEGFTAEHVSAAGARGDRALLAMVADLCLPAEVAALLPREGATRGFDWVAPEERLAWRAIVVLLAPALLLALALVGRMRA